MLNYYDKDYHLSVFQKLRHSDTCNQVKSCTKDGKPDQSQRELTVALSSVTGAGIFFGRGSQIYKKVGVEKTATPLFRQQIFYDPPSPIHLTPPQQAKIEISLFEQNKHTICGHLVTPYTYIHFGHQKFYDPPIFLSKNL